MRNRVVRHCGPGSGSTVHRKRSNVFLLLGLVLLLLTATGCAVSKENAPVQPAGGVYRPPSAVPQTPLVIPLASPSPTPRQYIPPIQPSATPICSNDLRYLEDLTIPDGTVVQPGEELDKRWQVENIGTCNWDDRYRLKLVDGARLGATKELALYPARSSTRAAISIQFTAPKEPGAYRSAWRAFDPQGEPFGDLIYVEIIVASIKP